MEAGESLRIHDAFHSIYSRPNHADGAPVPGLLVDLVPAPSLSRRDLLACFALIESSSSQAYKDSSRGWNPVSKKQEMKQDSLYYLLVRSNGPEQHNAVHLPKATVAGFLSFEFTLEERVPMQDGLVQAAYCWEIHLCDRLRGHGAGRNLMHLMESIAKLCDRQRTMLCVFKSNQAAGAFYAKLGYRHFKPGEMPQPRTLRGRPAIQPIADSEYLIKDLSSGEAI